MTIANQAYIDAVIAKCAALKSARLWAPEPIIRPLGWLSNFPPDDKTAAAILLDSFVFFSEATKPRLLVGAFEAAARTPPRSARSLRPGFLRDAVFTGVLGEKPNPTDSAFAITRMVRQHLSVPEDRFLSLHDALERAERGIPVVFVDDVTITGDQFMTTWSAPARGSDSFKSVAANATLEVACIYLVATASARQRIEKEASPVRLYATHCLDDSNRYDSLPRRQPPPLVPDALQMVEALLDRHTPTLRFRDDDSYMNKDPMWKRLGSRNAASYSRNGSNVPDGTLPIFWADGPSDSWIPLCEAQVNFVDVIRDLFGDYRAEWPPEHFANHFVRPAYFAKLESAPVPALWWSRNGQDDGTPVPALRRGSHPHTDRRRLNSCSRGSAVHRGVPSDGQEPGSNLRGARAQRS
ncbi:MAG: hypothetical protein IPM79_25400 [Polyangiaceae bacterium]|nr:hypothetical protein [Polyangiaceae bacterium]